MYNIYFVLACIRKIKGSRDAMDNDTKKEKEKERKNE